MIKSEILRKNNISYFLSLAIQELKSYGYDTERLDNAKKVYIKTLIKYITKILIIVILNWNLRVILHL